MSARNRTRHIKQVWFRYTGKYQIVKTGKVIEVENCLGHDHYNGIKLYPGPSKKTDNNGAIYVKAVAMACQHSFVLDDEHPTHECCQACGEIRRR